jgi:threonine/homoserine/homoserine lactone efflux protein
VATGIYFLFFKKVKVNEEGKQIFKFRRRDYSKIFLSGYFMNTLNPSVFIFWIYISTVIIDLTLQQKIIAFITCLLWMLGTDILKVFLAGKIRNRLTPHNIHIVNRINGLLLIVFGIALVWGLIIYGKRI